MESAPLPEVARKLIKLIEIALAQNHFTIAASSQSGARVGPEWGGGPKVMAVLPIGAGSMRAQVFQASERDKSLALPSSPISVCGCYEYRRGGRPPESVNPPACQPRLCHTR